MSTEPLPDAVRPLFRVDPGWPFVVGGLLLVVAGVLIPAQRELHDLREALEVQRAVEDQSVRQLAAYDRFLNDLEHGEPRLVKRLAASQLNLMPVGERPYLFAPSVHGTVTDWIEASEPLELPEPAAYPDTLLSRLAQGPRRLWVLGCGVFLTFLGLMLGPTAAGAVATRRLRDAAPDARGIEGRGAFEAASSVASTSDVEVEDAEIEDVEVGDVAVEDAEIEDAEIEDVEVEDVEDEDVEDEDVEIEDVEIEDVEIEDVEEPGIEGVVREFRAETEVLDALDETLDVSLGGCEGGELPIGEELPSAWDRALDVRSLFEGLPSDRWIETHDPRADA